MSMTALKPKLVHVFPITGGLATYGAIMTKLYAGVRSVTYAYLQSTDNQKADQLISQLLKLNPDIVHFEVGSNQANLFYVSRYLQLQHPEIKQMVTIHDTSLILAHPSGISWEGSTNTFLLLRKIGRKVSDIIARHTRLNSWLADKRITFIVLRSESLRGAQYLPHPTFLSNKPAATKNRSQVNNFGFAGYWSPTKGLETLLTAYQIFHVSSRQSVKLVIHGSGFSGKDSFIIRFESKAKQVNGVQLPGSMPEKDINKLLGELDVVVLPYWASNPAGASGMAMRAAEMGRPIIASQAPQLTKILGCYATYYEPADDAQTLAKAMSRVYENYSAAMKKAISLQKLIFSKHSHVVVQQRLDEIISSLL